MSKSGVLAEPALVGREKELEELQTFLNSAIEGKGKTVFISGEAGAGKTRLVTEFLKMVKKSDITVLTGWCLSNAAVPYFPFFEAFNAYFTGEPSEGAEFATDISGWLKGPAQSEKPLGISPQVWKDQTFVAVAKTLASISAKKSVILFLDDLHWADSASLALIHYIARAVASEKILVIATYRTEALTIDAEGRPRPLVETLRLMRRENLFNEVRLEPLDQERVFDLARNMLGGDLQPKFAEKLSGESQGNPLFVVESLRMLSECDGLIQERDKWRLTHDELGLPDKIKDIILQRLVGLAGNKRKVLDAASVIGERFDAQLLASALGLELSEVLETLDAIARATSLVCCEGELFKFDHGRSRDAVYSEISPALRRMYHSKVAEKLEEMGKTGGSLATDLAYHFAEAGSTEKALKYALEAGQNELARWSNTEAARHFQYVLQTIGDSPERRSERMTALEGLGDAFSAGNILKEAAKTFEQLAEFESGVAKLRALRKAAFAAFFMGDPSLLARLAKKAEENATADRLEAARVLQLKVRAINIQGDLATALKMVEEASKIYEEEYALSDAAWSQGALGFDAVCQGQLERAVEGVLRAIALIDDIGDVRSKIGSFQFVGHTFLFCWLLEDARRWYEKVIELNEQTKMGDYLSLIGAYSYSSITLGPNELPNAISLTLKALELSEKTDSSFLIGAIYELLVRYYAYAEDNVRMEEFFQKLVSLPKNVISITPNQMNLRLTLAVYYAARHDFEKSNKYFDDHFSYFKAVWPCPFAEAYTRQYYAWALNRQGKLEEAKFQAEEAQRIIEAAQKRFSPANVKASLMTFVHPEVNQTFEIRLDLVNVSKRQCTIVKVENLLVPELEIIDFSSNCLVHDNQIELKDKMIKSFEVKTVKVSAKAAKSEEFRLNPTVTYVDDLGETKTSSTRPFTITVQPAKPTYEALPGRINTGTGELDRLLLGGIPERYAIILAAPSYDQRQLLIKGFLEAGAKAGETTLYITCEESINLELAERFQPNFGLLFCNPQADLIVQSLPNVYKLKGIENLTHIDIALTKYLRTLAISGNAPKRACVALISDVLLQHHAVVTRKWLSSLLATLRSKGFTMLAVIDPGMHPSEEINAILGLFDGEIRIAEKETAKGMAKTLRVLRLQGQNYLKDEAALG